MPQPLPASLPELHALVAAFGTPLQLYSADGIRAQASMLQRAFLVHFPAFKEYYAVKALPNPSILRLVLDSGCGLDCSSSGELWVAEQLGVKGEDIMFTSNYTSDADLAQAARLGAIINLDDVSLVGQLAQVCRAAKLPFPELICFRLNPGMGNTQSETVSNLLGGPTAKFGVPPDDIVECYRLARAAGAKRFGLHMMTGSCVLEEAYWSATVAKLMEVAVAVKKQVGIEFEFVNIGGGLGIPYRADQQVVDLDGVAARVRAEFVKAYGPDRSKWPRLCMENGRFITGPCGWLVSRCNAVKTAFGTRFYGLDACMANLMRPGMYNSYHHITVPTSSQAVEPCNVVGTLCENNDWFASQRPLPRAAKGDLFVIHDTGAHSHSMGFQYNSKLRAPEVLLETGKAPRLIRTRETNADLFANAMEFVAGGGGGAGLPLASSLPKTSSPPAAAVRMTLCGLVGLVLLAGAAKWR